MRARVRGVLYLFDTTRTCPSYRNPSEELCVGIIEYCRRAYAPGSVNGRMKLNPLAVSRRALRGRRRQHARRPRVRRKLWVNLLRVCGIHEHIHPTGHVEQRVNDDGVFTGHRVFRLLLCCVSTNTVARRSVFAARRGIENSTKLAQRQRTC